MSDEILVKVEGVSKKFCRSLKKSLWYGVSDIARDLNPFASRQKAEPTSESGLRKDEFWAVNDVSFELRRGECLGLIGRNGAGKTTLLKILNGLIKPDAGRIEMRGRVGALIALGAGFNPILTGRENVYVNGSVLGLTKREIDASMEDIIDFADIREFIDSPVQGYSSGMQVRLGFAVATAMEPDVLILDEVLAVGDAMFRNKCYARIGNMQKRAAVIFVSHAMDQVARLCSLGLFMSKGRTSGMSSAEKAVELYEQSNESDDAEASSFCRLNDPVEEATFVLDDSDIFHNGALNLKLKIKTRSELNAPFMRLFFFGADGSLAGEWNTDIGAKVLNFKPGESEVAIVLPSITLRPGLYRVSLIMHEKNSIKQPVWFHKYHLLKVNGVSTGVTHHLLADGQVSLRHAS